VTWTAPDSGLVAVVGPNGAGKSTLVKAALGLVPLFSGRITLLGGTVSDMRRRVAYVPQRAAIDWEFPATARDVVAMGLYPKLGLFRWVTRAVKDAAGAALAAVGLQGLEDRPIGALSAGQPQRVPIARALAQNTDMLMLDEPFVGVDAPSEDAILGLFGRLRGEGRLVICVHHDLDTVAERFDHVVLLATRLVASGAPAATLTPETLRAAYGPGHGVHGTEAAA
jgi:manganese/zinc/iron transport system ATP- binding protein